MGEALADAPAVALLDQAWPCQRVDVRAALVACMAPYEDELGSTCLCS